MTTKAQSINRGWLGTFTVGICAISSAIALYEIRVRSAFNGFDERFNDLISTRVYLERPDLVIRDFYTGIPYLDNGLRFLVGAFLPLAAPFEERFQMQLIYFLFSFFPVLTIMTVESVRIGNRWSWIKYTSFWALLYQSIGGAVIIPIWVILFFRHTSRVSSYDPQALRVPAGIAKALIPSLTLGYLLPTISLFVPFDDPGLSIRQILLGYWQPSPIYVNIILVVLARFLGETSQALAPSSEDVTLIKSSYVFSFLVSASAHIFILYQWTQSTWSLSEIFVPQRSSPSGRIQDVLFYIFQLDLAIIFSILIITAYVTVTDLRRLGKDVPSSLAIGAFLILHTLAIGPGATVALVWWLRENKLRVSETGKGKKGL